MNVRFELLKNKLPIYEITILNQNIYELFNNWF